MTKPYTYLLKHLPTNKFYYGVRYAKNCEPNDFWVKYFTSSNKVKKLIKEYGKNSFSFEIRKTFSNIESAILWEQKLLKRMKLPHREDFLNHRYSYAIKSMSAESHPLFGVGHNEKSREKMSISHKGKKLSSETRNKMSISRKGDKNPCFGKYGKEHPAYGLKRTEEFKMKLSENFKRNNPMHDESKRKKMIESIKDLKWWTNGVEVIRSKESPGKEWKRGRKKYAVEE